MTDYTSIEQTLGYTFKNKRLLEQALTHSSYAKENHVDDYERLEFLGDSLLDYLIALLLYENFPEKSEGEMTKLRAALVKEETLAKLNDELHLNDYIRIADVKQSHPVTQSKAVKCDIFEAVIGAVLLDSEYDLTFLKPYLQNLFRPYLYIDNTDYKSLLLEYFSRNNISYDFAFFGEFDIKNPEYHVKLLVKGIETTVGNGRTKKSAQQDACRNYFNQYIR